MLDVVIKGERKLSEERAGPDAAQPQHAKLVFSRAETNFWLDAAMLVVFLALVFVSVVVRFVFPTAASTSGWTLWGASLDQWMDIQFGLLGLFSFAVLVHLMLHWNWVCGVVTARLLRARDGKKRTWDEGTKTIVGVGLMIVLLNLLGVLIAAAALSIQRPL